MFERFTDRARRVVVLAQEEARLLNHGYIGSEHVLLGVLAEAHGVGAQALVSMGVTIDAARAKVVALVGRGDRVASGHIPFTPQAKRALEGALREALQLGAHEIGTEHLLLGLIREGDSTAARTLEELDVDLAAVRRRVVDIGTGVTRAEGAPALAVETAPGVVPFGGSLSGRVAACAFCGRDLWEVDRYVLGAQAAICDACAVAARDALDDDKESRSVVLPPRVFGEPPAAGAVDAIGAALAAAFGAASEPGERIAAVEGGERFVLAFAATAERYPDVAVRFDRVRFESAEAAEVRLALLIEGGVGPVFEGRVVCDSGSWKVGQELAEAVLRAAGAHVPTRGHGIEGRETPSS